MDQFKSPLKLAETPYFARYGSVTGAAAARMLPAVDKPLGTQTNVSSMSAFSHSSEPRQQALDDLADILGRHGGQHKGSAIAYNSPQLPAIFASEGLNNG